MPSGNIIAPMLYLLLCTSFCDQNGDLAHNLKFLLEMKYKTAGKISEQQFLMEFKGLPNAKIPVNLSQYNQKLSEMHCRLVMHLKALQLK